MLLAMKDTNRVILTSDSPIILALIPATVVHLSLQRMITSVIQALSSTSRKSSKKSDTMGQARRSHTKSRNGCQECKRKKIKCDENTPCSRCVKFVVNCSLNASNAGSNLSSARSGSASSPELNAHEKNDPVRIVNSFAASDFGLFHHFLTSTTPCMALSHGPEAMETMFSWKSDLPSLAPQYPYVLHEILAVAAIHLHHLNPKSPTNYQRVAWDHQAKAFSQFRVALMPENAGSQAHALFACSALMSNYYFAAFEDPASLLFNNDPPGPPEWILPIRGCTALVRQLRESLEANSSWASLQTNLDSWAEPSTPEMSESHREIQSLQERLSTFASDGENRSLYEEEFRLLRRSFAIAGKAGNASCKIAAMMFAGAVSENFLRDMSIRRRPEALVMMAFWCVLLSRLDQRCWLRDDSVPEAILGVIESLLPSAYIELIRWPVQEIRAAATPRSA